MYAAENTIEELAKMPSIGWSFQYTPYNDKNSPTKFNVRGAPQLPRHNIKNIMENTGIICARPL